MLEVRALYDKLNGKVCETQGRSLLVRAVGVEPTRTASRSKRFKRPILRFAVVPSADTPKVRQESIADIVERPESGHLRVPGLVVHSLTQSKPCISSSGYCERRAAET